VPRRVLIALVRFYRYWISPSLGSNCLYEPSCSAYALQALQRHGALAGSYLAVARIARCTPWCEARCDPVPDAPPRLFSRLISSPPEKNTP
jgi:hypothetical protein